METRFSSGRLTFLGVPTPWMKQFLTSLQQIGTFDVHWESNISRFLSTPVPRNRVTIVVLEQSTQGRDLMDTLRASGKAYLLIWVGKQFSKEDLQYAYEMRVHSVLEKPLPDDPKVLDKFRKAVVAAETSERTEDLAYAVKAVLLHLADAPDDDAAMVELKTGLLKLQRNAVYNEFLGQKGEVEAMDNSFAKVPSFADALMTVEDLERTGTLMVRTRDGKEGLVDFLQGRPIAAVCGETRSLKAIYRMFLWEGAMFSFTRRNPKDMIVEERLNFTLREICLEGQALYARFDKIREQVPPLTLRLQIEPSSLHTGTKLDDMHFSTLSSVVEQAKVAQILDYNTLPDVVLYEWLINLKKNGLIRVAA